jgi:hypothetical protein
MVALPPGFPPNVQQFGVEGRPRHQKRPVWLLPMMSVARGRPAGQSAYLVVAQSFPLDVKRISTFLQPRAKSCRHHSGNCTIPLRDGLTKKTEIVFASVMRKHSIANVVGAETRETSLRSIIGIDHNARIIESWRQSLGRV